MWFFSHTHTGYWYQIELCSAFLCPLGYTSWDKDDERGDGTAQETERWQDRVDHPAQPFYHFPNTR